MKLTSLILAFGLMFGTSQALNAQTASQMDAATAAIEAATAICAKTPLDCAAAVEAAVAAMDAAGISGAALDGVLGQLAGALTEIGAQLPPAVQVQIAAAMDVVLTKLSPNAPQRQAIMEISAALASGTGATITATIPSPT